MGKSYKETKDSQDAYIKKLYEIKIRIPNEYYDKVKQCADDKNMSINKWLISLLEKEIGEEIVTIREKNRLQKESQ